MNGPSLALLAAVLAVGAGGAGPAVTRLTGDPVILDTFRNGSHPNITHYLVQG